MPQSTQDNTQETRFKPRQIIDGLRRIKMVVEYDGAAFHGWQIQTDPPVPTIEAAILEAFEQITATKPEDLVAAGRTDRGVHATHMTCHLDTFAPIALNKIQTGLNRFLPDTIAVREVEEVDQNFHARYSCVGRKYTYKILNRRNRSPLYHARAEHVPHALDLAEMQRAAKVLEGEHDLSSFRSAECQGKGPVTTLKSIELEKTADDIINIYLEGVTFLHNMVRIITGTLIEVGSGKRTAEDIQALLEARDRTKAGKTANPNGLYFTEALY
ncbi:MAG: tRNA pseudouridine(38-40) synthase TruA [Magnetococcales bacterium]|nr:tRNA pseudouridine(38-40) synthase TruA [Magnetococcales bacterium]